MIREKRHIFLHKGCWSTFKGYAYAQMHKMRTKVPEGKRVELIEKYGYDVKFAYHVVRLLNEVQQIMTEETLDLDRNSEQLKAIRRGDWSLKQVEDYFFDKEKQLEKLYLDCKLPLEPNREEIKNLLLHCLEQHFGSLENCVESTDKNLRALKEIRDIVNKLD